MKKIKYIIASLAFVSLAACSVEDPFQGEKNSGTGQFSKAALQLNVTYDPNTGTRAENQDFLNDFVIVFQTVATTPVTVASYKYSEMPEVVTLEANKYTVTATYGENHDAKFENPHYKGMSEEFEVKPNEITTSLGTIKCALANVKVTINFHSSLTGHMSDDSYVEVYVNKDASLKFTKDHASSSIAGYFKHSDVNTLTATFHGTVDGVEMNEVKTLQNVQPGYHYALTFKRHDYQNEENGEIEGGIDVEASVTVVDLNRNVTIMDDEVLDDSERPSEDDPSGGEDPGTDPEDPDTPDEPSNDPPVITPIGVDLNEVNELVDGMSIILYITSGSSISSFIVEIGSTDDGFMQAIDEMISSKFDLIELDKNEGLGEALSLLGFPVGEDVSNPSDVDENGNGKIKFEITSDLQILLKAYEGTHEFKFTVENEAGKTQESLKLRVTK